MPDMPAQEGQAAPAQAEQGGGGGVSEALVGVDKELLKIVQAVSKAPVSDGVKQAFASAHEGYRAALESLMAEAGGGQPQAAPGGQGTVSPEQGGSGAVPQSHAGMRG